MRSGANLRASTSARLKQCRAKRRTPRRSAKCAQRAKCTPPWGALLKRLRGVASVTIPEPALSESSEAPADKSALALDLLRCYRFRREQDLDALTDRLFPELAQ